MKDVIAFLRAMGERSWPLDAGGALSVGKQGQRQATGREVNELAADGLIELSQGCARRSDAGRARVRRGLATASERGDVQPFGQQHRDMRQQEIVSRGVALPVSINAAESPLAWLASRKDKSGAPFIDAVQCAAGERLHRDFSRGHQSPRVTQSWDASGVRGSQRPDGMLISESAEAARRRVENALSAVGRDLSDALYGVCCREEGLEVVEKRCGWPLRSGKLVLRIALDRLVEHYGMGAATGRECAAMAHWGTADFRPKAH
ncbi:MAG: DUF6456 domain-containing protein [Pseudomonadota bacterium]